MENRAPLKLVFVDVCSPALQYCHVKSLKETDTPISYFYVFFIFKDNFKDFNLYGFLVCFGN